MDGRRSTPWRAILLALLFYGVTNTLGGAFLSRMYSGADAVQFSIWHTAVWFVAALTVVMATKANLGRKRVTEAKAMPMGRSLVTG